MKVQKSKQKGGFPSSLLVAIPTWQTLAIFHLLVFSASLKHGSD